MELDKQKGAKLKGVMAEFDRPEDVLAAVKDSAKAGYRFIDAYSPYHVEGLAKALGMERNGIAPIVLAGGVIGGLTGYAMQYYCVGINYPINAAGRPLNSIPAFIPITFELTILFASLAAILGVFFLSGLPRLWQPVFSLPRFVERASKNGFFLWIESRDPKFHREETRAFLESLNPREIHEIEV